MLLDTVIDVHTAGKLVDKERISRCLQTLQSTSPNYLLLASLDATGAKLRRNPEAVFDNAICLAKEAKNLIKQIPGISALDSENLSCFPAVVDPLRMTVGVRKLGLSGFEADEFSSQSECHPRDDWNTLHHLYFYSGNLQ
ncbi:hypothetical protein Droror1_Dr00017048 [Drosera rotundifolia]